MLNQREEDFRQRAFASALAAGADGIAMYRTVFESEDENAPVEAIDDTEIYYPSSPEDLETMLAEWEAMDAGN